MTGANMQCTILTWAAYSAEDEALHGNISLPDNASESKLPQGILLNSLGSFGHFILSPIIKQSHFWCLFFSERKEKHFTSSSLLILLYNG